MTRTTDLRDHVIATDHNCSNESTTDVEIVRAPERFTTTGALTGGRPGWWAIVRYSQTFGGGRRTARPTVHLSRLDGEQRWVIDSLFSERGVPVFVTSPGSRYTALTLAHDEVGRVLDLAVADAQADEPATDGPGPFDG